MFIKVGKMILTKTQQVTKNIRHLADSTKYEDDSNK